MASLDTLCPAVVSYVENYAGFHALCPHRLYPHPLPEDRVIPSTSWELETCPALHVGNHARAHIRFTTWAYTKLLALQIAEQIRLALEKYHGDFGTVHAFSMVEDMAAGTYEPAPSGGLYPIHVYARVWFRQDT